MPSHWKIRQFKIPLSVALPLLIFEFIYLIAGNLFINGQMLSNLMNGKPEEFHLHYHRAWTIFPGYVHIQDLTLGGHSGPIEWNAQITHIRALINPLTLFQRKLDVRWVRGTNTVYDMQWVARIEKPEKTETKAELPTSQPTSLDRGPFKFEISDIYLKNFNHIGIDGYNYNGAASLRGGFFLWPGRQLRIQPTTIRFDDGTVTKQRQIVAQKFTGTVDTAIADFFEQKQSEDEILDGLDSDIHLSAELNRADFLNLYFGALPWLKMTDVSGGMRADIAIAKGVLQPSTHIRVEASKLAASLSSLQASGRGLAEWKIVNQPKAAPEIELRLSLDKYAIQHQDQPTDYIKGDQLSILASSRDLALKKLFGSHPDLLATIEVPTAEILDLRFINRFLPNPQQLELLSGQGELNARISAATQRAAPAGFVHLVTENLGARFEKSAFRGGLEIDARLAPRADRPREFELAGSAIGLTKIEFGSADGGTTPGPRTWNGKMQLVHANLAPQTQPVFRGKLQLDFEDARPFLFIFAGGQRLAPQLVNILSLKNLHGQADLVLGKELIDIEQAKFDSAALSIKGEIRLEKNEKKGVALFRHGFLELGLGVQNDKVDFKIFNAKKWYEKLSKQR